MRLFTIVSWFCVTALLSQTAIGGTSQLVVPVSEDASINLSNPNGNLNTLTTRGGLFSGLDNTGSDYHFFLKFILPAKAPGETLQSATLVGTYTDKFGGPASFHQIYFVPGDAWPESTITANTAPAFGDGAGAAFEAFGKTPGTAQSFDVSGVVLQEFNGDGVLSLAFATIDGRFSDLEYFASKEFSQSQAFRLNLTFTNGTAVPLPGAVSLGAVGMLMTAVGMNWRSRRARAAEGADRI